MTVGEIREGEKRGFSSVAEEVEGTGAELRLSFAAVAVVVVVTVEFDILETGKAAILAGLSKELRYR